MVPGDLVQINLRGVCSDKFIGILLSISPESPQIPRCDSQQSRPGPIFNLKVLKIDGEIWDSWIDQNDTIETL